MTSGTHALTLAQSAFEAVCKERDEALAKLSTVHCWVEKNVSGGFIDSLTHLQNLECVADDWYGRLVETIRERDEAREEAINKTENIQLAANRIDELKNRSEHWCDMHTIAAKERDEAREQLKAMREAIREAYEALAGCTEDSGELLSERDWWKDEPRCDYQVRHDEHKQRIEDANAALAKLQPFIAP